VDAQAQEPVPAVLGRGVVRARSPNADVDGDRGRRGRRAPQGARCRHWVFTLNAPTDVQVFGIRAAVDAGRAKYLCFQGEIAPTTGTKHLQGFVSFNDPVTMGACVKRLGPGKPHVERMRSTIDECVAYCQKEDTADPDRPFVEFGVRPAGAGNGSGSRTDWEEIRDLLKEGQGLEAIAESHPGHFIRYTRGIERLSALYESPRREKTLVYWYYGATGTGKSRLAFACYPDAYVKMGTNKWWDGYEHNDAVVIDDYRVGLCPFNELLRMFDRNPLRVEAKGCTKHFNSGVIVVTAPKAPLDMWAGREAEDLNQLMRRITYVRNFNVHPWDREDKENPTPARVFDAVEGEERDGEPEFNPGF